MTPEAIYRAALEEILVEADSFEGVLIADLVCRIVRAALEAAAQRGAAAVDDGDARG